MFKIGYRTIKTALGATLAIIISQMLNLENFASAGIITILCIQVTKKKSVYASWHRFLACLIAMTYSFLMFQFIAFHPLIIGLILLIFIPTTVALKINEGIVTSCVIILHLYGSGHITFSLVMNETILIAVGIGVALVMNLYMPSVDDKLLDYQERIETNFSEILMGIVRYLRDNDHTWGERKSLKRPIFLMKPKALLSGTWRITF